MCRLHRGNLTIVQDIRAEFAQNFAHYFVGCSPSGFGVDRIRTSIARQLTADQSSLDLSILLGPCRIMRWGEERPYSWPELHQITASVTAHDFPAVVKLEPNRLGVHVFTASTPA